MSPCWLSSDFEVRGEKFLSTNEKHCGYLIIHNTPFRIQSRLKSAREHCSFFMAAERVT